MADKEVLVIEIDVEKSISKAAELRQEMDVLIARRQDLTEKSKAGDIEAVKEIEKVSSAYRNLSTDLKAQQRILDGYAAQVKKNTDVVNFQNNSINENRALLKQLTAQYNDLKNPLQKDTDLVNSLSEAIKKQEAAIGNTSRNVGNYSASIKDAFKGISVGGTTIGNVVDPLKNITNGFKNAGGGAAGLSAGLAQGLLVALPLVVAGFGKVVDVFKTYKPLADAVEDATVGVEAGFRALVLGGSVKEAANQAIEYTRVMRDLEDSQQIFNTAQTESANRVKELVLQSKNKLLTDQERLEVLNQASRNEKRAHEEQIKRVNEEIAANEKIIVSRAHLTEAQRTQFKEGSAQQKEEIRELLEKRGVEEKFIEGFEKAIQRRAELEGESIALREKINNRIADIENKRQQDEERANEKAAANREKQLKEQEAYLNNLTKLETEFLLSERERLSKSFDDKLATIQGNSAREQELRLAILQDQALALQKFDDDAEKAREAKREEKRQKEAQRLSEVAARNSELEQLRIESLSSGLEKEEQLYELAFEKRVEDLRAAGLTEIEIESLKQQELSGIRSAYLKKELAEQTAAAAEKKKLREAEVMAAQNVAGAFSAIGNAIGAQTAEGIAFQKVATGIQIAINTAKAISEAIAGATAAAASSGPAAPFLLVGYIAAMIGTVVGAVAQATQLLSSANTPEPPKFAGGVISIDGPGSETSDDIPAYLSRGESVVTAKATRRFHRELAWMEQSVGNSPNYQFGKGMFASGFIPTLVHGDGGMVARDIARSSNDIAIVEAIKQGFQSAPQPVLEIVELNKKQDSRNRSIEISGM